MRNRSHANKTGFLLRLTLSCLILIYLIGHIDFKRFTAIATKLHSGYILGAFCLLILLNLLVAIRWSLLLRYLGIIQGILDSWLYYMIGGFYSIILPGVIGGDVVRLALSIKSHNHAKAIITTSIIFERVCGITVLMLMASAAATLSPMLLKGETAIAQIITWIAPLGIVAFTIIFIILKNLSPDWIKSHTKTDHWRTTLFSLLKHFRDLPIKGIAIILILSVSAHLSDIVGCFLLGCALQLHQPLYVFLFMMPIVYVVTMIPISIGGLGVREGVLTYFLVKVGVLTSDAVILAFAIYVNRIFVGIVGGFLQMRIKRST